MADLSEEETQKVSLAFSIYDQDGIGQIDAAQLGDLLRACDLNPTNALIEKFGGTKKKGEKFFTLEEILLLFSDVKKDKDQGVFEDFVECLKLYDKQEDGTMVGAELLNILLTLGEKLTEAEVDEVAKDCLDPEDDDGMIPYVPFLARICQREIPANTNPFSN